MTIPIPILIVAIIGFAVIVSLIGTAFQSTFVLEDWSKGWTFGLFVGVVIGCLCGIAATIALS